MTSATTPFDPGPFPYLGFGGDDQTSLDMVATVRIRMGAASSLGMVEVEVRDRYTDDLLATGGVCDCEIPRLPDVTLQCVREVLWFLGALP